MIRYNVTFILHSTIRTFIALISTAPKMLIAHRVKTNVSTVNTIIRIIIGNNELKRSLEIVSQRSHVHFIIKCFRDWYLSILTK